VQHLVRRAEADPERVSQIALTEVQIALKQAQDLKMGIVTLLIAALTHAEALSETRLEGYRTVWTCGPSGYRVG
jgi:hypothetical protein